MIGPNDGIQIVVVSHLCTLSNFIGWVGGRVNPLCLLEVININRGPNSKHPKGCSCT